MGSPRMIAASQLAALVKATPRQPSSTRDSSLWPVKKYICIFQVLPGKICFRGGRHIIIKKSVGTVLDDPSRVRGSHLILQNEPDDRVALLI